MCGRRFVFHFVVYTAGVGGLEITDGNDQPLPSRRIVDPGSSITIECKVPYGDGDSVSHLPQWRKCQDEKYLDKDECITPSLVTFTADLSPTLDADVESRLSAQRENIAATHYLELTITSM